MRRFLVSCLAMAVIGLGSWFVTVPVCRASAAKALARDVDIEVRGMKLESLMVSRAVSSAYLEKLGKHSKFAHSYGDDGIVNDMQIVDRCARKHLDLAMYPDHEIDRLTPRDALFKLACAVQELDAVAMSARNGSKHPDAVRADLAAAKAAWDAAMKRVRDFPVELPVEFSQSD